MESFRETIIGANVPRLVCKHPRILGGVPAYEEALRKAKKIPLCRENAGKKAQAQLGANAVIGVGFGLRDIRR